jgi:hypothetical protein
MPPAQGSGAPGVERTYVPDDDFELPPPEKLAAGTECWLR